MDCPNCKINLKENGVKYIKDYATVVYNVWLVKDDLHYELDGAYRNAGVFVCSSCDKELAFTPEEVRKYLK